MTARLTVEKADVIDNWQMTIDNWGIGFADDFKYNYTEVRLFKGFVKISAEGAQQLSIIHCQLSICDKIAKSGFIDKLKSRF